MKNYLTMKATALYVLLLMMMGVMFVACSNEEYFDNERPKTMATRAASYAGEPGETGNTNAVPRYFAKGKFPIHLFHLEDEIDTCSVSFMFHADEHGILTDTVLTFNNEALLNPEVVVAKPALVNRKMYFKIQIRGQMEKDNTTYSVSGEKYGEVTNVEILTGR